MDHLHSKLYCLLLLNHGFVCAYFSRNKFPLIHALEILLHFSFKLELKEFFDATLTWSATAVSGIFAKSRNMKDLIQVC